MERAPFQVHLREVGSVLLGNSVVPFYSFRFWVPIYNILTEKRVLLL